ncbi:MAG TPA: hypothetical protein VF043_22090 [Ktedonobacteraceae bacterium]
MPRTQKRPRKRRRQPQSRQPYDNALKALMEDHAVEVIPEFIPEAAVVIEQSNEIKRENLRADLVYLIHYRNQLHVLDMELQTDKDSNMPTRMLRYHVDLHLAYSLPVISVVLYLFETSIPKSPYREESGDEELLTLHYRVIALWTLDAQEYVKKRIIGMYTFLPGMKGATASLLKQAIEEMKDRYGQPQVLARHLAWFKTILHRSGTLSEEDKQKVENYMQVYDSLIDQDPYFQQRLANKAEEMAAKRAAEKELQVLQQVALDAVEDRYPSLLELAREKIVLTKQADALRLLVRQINKTPDEKTARWLLDTLSLQSDEK